MAGATEIWGCKTQKREEPQRANTGELRPLAVSVLYKYTARLGDLVEWLQGLRAKQRFWSHVVPRRC